MAPTINPKNVGASARIRVEVEIDAPGNYGGDWTVAELLDQAGREAVVKLENMLREKGGRIIGTPQVLLLTAERKP